MIFIILGSREYQFDRLLKKLDEINLNNNLTLNIFAQIGNSNYIPKTYNFERFIDNSKFNELIDRADIIVSHGGTGALINSLKKKKRVIGIPRMKKYKEHVDDHQFQIIDVLEEEKYILTDKTENLELLEMYLSNPEIIPIKEYNRESNIIEIINNFLEGEN